MSSALDLRVADALHIIAGRIQAIGLEHPESLYTELPAIRNVCGVRVSVHVEVEEDCDV